MNQKKKKKKKLQPLEIRVIPNQILRLKTVFGEQVAGDHQFGLSLYFFWSRRQDRNEDENGNENSMTCGSKGRKGVLLPGNNVVDTFQLFIFTITSTPHYMSKFNAIMIIEAQYRLTQFTGMVNIYISILL